MPNGPTQRLARLESDNLLTILEEFTNDDLAPIVDILVGATSMLPGPRLKDAPAYKVHAPDHRRYRREIEADIRAWGSHEIADAEEPKAYRDIVADLCSQRNVTPMKGMLAIDMERALLKAVRDSSSASLLTKAKETMAAKPAKTATAAAGGVAVLGRVAKLAKRGRTTRWLVPPGSRGVLGGPRSILTAVWAAWDLLGPAYRVTGPCVLVIAQARFRLWCATMAKSLEVGQ